MKEKFQITEIIYVINKILINFKILRFVIFLIKFIDIIY